VQAAGDEFVFVTGGNLKHHFAVFSVESTAGMPSAAE
jgi:hypothetical protein